MRSHRAIWSFAALMVLAAIALVSLRDTARTVHDATQAREDEGAKEEHIIGSMIVALQRDPRVRRVSTRVLVENAAALLDEGMATRAEVQYARGMLKYYGEEDLPGAEGAFRRAASLSPEWPWAHNVLAIVLYAQGKTDEAEASWREAIRLDPTWVRPYNDRAIQYRRAGRMDDARAQLEQALAMDPSDPITRYNYGVFRDITGDHAGARGEYEIALATDPEMPAAHYNLACSYAREGRIEKAAGYLEEAIRLNPAFREEAKRDPDFDLVRDERPYKRIVLEAPG